MELSKEVFRLKEALGALSPPLGLSSSHSSSHSHSERVPPVNPGQQVALQNRVAVLSKELQVRASLSQNKYRGSWFKECWSILSVLYILLQDWERKHRQVVAVYRSHLLAAVQVSTTLCTFVEDTSLSGQCNMKCCCVVEGMWMRLVVSSSGPDGWGGPRALTADPEDVTQGPGLLTPTGSVLPVQCKTQRAMGPITVLYPLLTTVYVHTYWKQRVCSAYSTCSLGKT